MPGYTIFKTAIENPCRLPSDVTPDGAGLSLPYAAVRGEVSPLGKSVSSAYAAESVTGVIQQVVFTEHKRNLSRAGFWFDSERVLHQYTNEAPFCLTKLQVVPPWIPYSFSEYPFNSSSQLCRYSVWNVIKYGSLSS